MQRRLGELFTLVNIRGQPFVFVEEQIASNYFLNFQQTFLYLSLLSPGLCLAPPTLKDQARPETGADGEQRDDHDEEGTWIQPLCSCIKRYAAAI